MTKKINWVQLLTIVILTEIIGLVSSILSGAGGQLYTSLIKPPLSPPPWVFGEVWPLLFLLMGIAAYLIFQEPKSDERKTALVFYWVQLFVNFLWPIVFFRFELYWLSVAVIIILDILVLITTILFYRLNKAAGYLFIPYLLWILFATYLNIGVALLN